MKSFAILTILTALALFGSAFFGIWTAPGLEDLPTVESLGKKRGEQAGEREQETGIIPMGRAPFQPEGVSAARQRARQIEAAGRKTTR